MFMRKKQSTDMGGSVAADSARMEEDVLPVAPVGGRTRRPLGDISNFVNSERAGPDGTLKKKATSAPAAAVIAPPLPQPSVADSSAAFAPASMMNFSMDERLYMRREADNIDIRDVDNHLMCTEVVNDMYANFKVIEADMRVDANYMRNQPHVNEKMRAILVDWLIEVHLKFKMVPETLYLTINVVDRYLQLKHVRRSKLQLLGVAALLIASKYEEIHSPEINDLVYITDQAYNKQEIIQMETQIVEALQFHLTVPTIHSFLCRYLKAAHADRTMVQLSCYLAERSLQEYKMLQFLPSVVASAAVLVARKSLNRHPWSPTLVKYTQYDEPDLAACVEEMRRYMSAAEIAEPGAATQEAVQKKYANSKFGSVSRTPLCF